MHVMHVRLLAGLSMPLYFTQFALVYTSIWFG